MSVIEEQQVIFDTSSDFEFGLHGKRQTEYFVFNSGYKDGLVVYIPGFGEDLGEYSKVFCAKTSKKYHMAALTLNYFCIGSRNQTGAKIEIFKSEFNKVKAAYAELGGVGEPSLEALSELLVKNDAEITLQAAYIPTKNEYQNFGILAAIDIVNAIQDAIKRFDLNAENIILVGSSYGGYLANLVTKIYPGLVRAVFDNSSWAHPNMKYIVGTELQFPEGIHKIHRGVILHVNTKTPWTLKPGLPHSFSGDRVEIRSFTQNQLSQMLKQGGQDTFYLFYHAEYDDVANTGDKIDMAKNMAELGFKNVMMNVLAESDIDGSLIKNMGHGMGMSMLKFFDVAYDYLQQINPKFQSNQQLKQAVYQLDDTEYHFDLSGDFVTGKVVVKH